MDQAESLRNIIKKQEIQPDRRGTARVITVTSGKGGVGKTSVSVNLAIMLSRLGKRVVMLDADFGLANVEVMFGIRPKYTLADLMFRGKNIAEIITYGIEGIGFISGGAGINELSALSREQILQLIHKMDDLDRMADVIIVDTGAGVGDAVLEFVLASQEVLLVATPEPTSITDAYALLKSLNQCSSYEDGQPSIKMIANQVRHNGDADELFQKIGVVVKRFLHTEIDYIGAIPYDENMSRAVMRQEPLCFRYPNSPAVKAMQEIVERLENRNPGTTRGAGGIMQFFSKVIRMKFNR